MKENRDQIEKEVIKVIADMLHLTEDSIRLDSQLVDDLGIDSFTVVELIFDLEDKYGIEIPDEDAVKIKKVEDIVSYLDVLILKN